MKSFTIERKSWLRGEGSRSRLLRSSDNKMCCLGFYAMSCGLSEIDIRDESTIGFVINNDLSLLNKVSRDINILIEIYDGDYYGTSVAIALVETNDNKKMKDCEREVEITKLFASVGVRVSFV